MDILKKYTNVRRVNLSADFSQHPDQDVQVERMRALLKMKADMAAISGQEDTDICLISLVKLAVGITGDPRIIFGLQHHNRNLDLL